MQLKPGRRARLFLLPEWRPPNILLCQLCCCSFLLAFSYDYCVENPFETAPPTLAPVVTTAPAFVGGAAVPLQQLVEISDGGNLPLGMCEGKLALGYGIRQPCSLTTHC